MLTAPKKSSMKKTLECVVVVIVCLVAVVVSQNTTGLRTFSNLLEDECTIKVKYVTKTIHHDDFFTQLNISWDKPNESMIANGIDISLHPKPMEPDDFELFDDIIDMQKRQHVIVPHPKSKFLLKLGEYYNVTLIHTGCSTLYKLPDCITHTFEDTNITKRRCDCLSKQTYVDMEVTHHSRNEYKVTWNITGPLLENRTYYVAPHRVDTFHHLKMKTLNEDLSWYSTTGTDYIQIDRHLISSDKADIKGEFRNSYDCPYFSYTTIDVQSDNTPLTVYISFYFLSSAIVVLGILYVMYQKKKYRTPECSIPMLIRRPTEVQNVLYISTFTEEDYYEFPEEKLTFIKEIASGAFGVVHLAKALGVQGKADYTYMAVKMLRGRPTPEEQTDFLAEMEMMKKIGNHPNVVQMLGYCTKQNYILMMEFVPCGDLRNYLLDLREAWNRRICNNNIDPQDCNYISPDSPKSMKSFDLPSLPSVSVTTDTTFLEPDRSPLIKDTIQFSLELALDDKELQSFALQIARGMAHLERLHITHRDLAARNVLVNEYKQLKISDFGMSRSGPYINMKTKRIPLRWMAIESIRDNQSNSRSDAWSFGVVLWEIGTLGAFPYETLDDKQLLHKLLTGLRLDRPEICTDELYRIMLECWSEDPLIRPTFEELVLQLDLTKQRAYVDFSHLNPSYVFPSANGNVI